MCKMTRNGWIGLIIAVAFLVCASWYLYPVKKKRLVLRENAAKLLPHQQKRVEECITLLAKEDYNTSLRRLLTTKTDNSPCSSSISVVPQSILFISQHHIIKMLAYRRCLKLFSDIESMDDRRKQKVVFEAFQFISIERKKVEDQEAISSIAKSGPRALSWAMFATAKFGTGKQLLDEVDQIRLAGQEFLEKFKKSGRLKYPSPEIPQYVYVDNCVYLNCITLMLKRMGADGKYRNLLDDLRREKYPIPTWDAPATLFEAGGQLLAMDAPYPPYVEIGNGWVEYIIYDWPDEMRLVGGEEAQEKRLVMIIDALRETVAQKK